MKTKCGANYGKRRFYGSLPGLQGGMEMNYGRRDPETEEGGRMRLPYEKASVQIILFSPEDIITTSAEWNNDCDFDDDTKDDIFPEN